MTREPDAPRPNDDAPASDSGPQNLSTARHRPSTRRYFIAGGSAFVLVAALVVAFTLNGMTPDAAAPGSGAAISSTSSSAPSPSPAVLTTPPKTFAPFDRVEYVQAGPPAASPLTSVQPTTVNVGTSLLGTNLPESLVGLSLESDVITDPRMDPANSDLVEVLQQLGTPVLRFGGNSVDRRLFWTSTDEPMPNWPVTKGQKLSRATPADLQRLKRLVDQTSAKVIVSVDMGHKDPARAADFAAHAQQILGSSLLGISIGNEPNGFTSNDYLRIRDDGWNFQSYVDELRPLLAAVTQAAPGAKIIGPDVYAPRWTEDFMNLKLPNLGALAFHHYPLSNCDKDFSQPGTPSAELTMSKAQADHDVDYNRSMNALAKAASLPTWLTETSISSCAGANPTTRKHVSALWAVDYSLGAASVGTTQVDLHAALGSCTGGYDMSPLCDKGTSKNPNGKIGMQPMYYGAMFVDAIGAGEFLKIDQTGGENVYSYAIRQSADKMSVVVVNQNDPSTAAQSAVTINLPAKAATGTMSQMTGPSFQAQDATRIDGLESPGVAASERPRIPGFAAGSQTIELPVTAGTATVLDFTF